MSETLASRNRARREGGVSSLWTAGDLPVCIVDFGSQFTQLLARRLRELHIFCEIIPAQGASQTLRRRRPQAVILSGGPQSVTDKNAPQLEADILMQGIPVLGICYGFQLMAQLLGGRVRRKENLKEYGQTGIRRNSNDAEDILEGLPDSFDVWMSHGDYVADLPKGFQVAACSDSIPAAAAFDPQRRLYGLQFHPEVAHTTFGQEILKTFIYKICKLSASWSPQNILEQTIGRIREIVGKKRVILGLSGGVDSSVAAALIHRAVGDQLQCVFIDTGLLRQDEAPFVIQTFQKVMNLPLIFEDAGRLFLKRLTAVTEPEEKRKVIGRTFIDIFKTVADRLEDITFLAQGTIYPDVIESSASGDQTHLIKSHHNVGGLPKELGFQLLEPLRFLFKDEVRALGKLLDLPLSLINRHPFPGPGLAIRTPGAVNARRLKLLRQADAIFLEELEKEGHLETLSQAFCVLLPTHSVGVVGDQRLYGPVISLRAVQTPDFMTAAAAELPFSFLKKVSRRITNEVHGISRVLFDLTDKPPASIEWE